MKIGLRALFGLTGVLLSAGGMFGDPVTYTYAGNNFTLAVAPYTTNNFVSGSFTVAAPLGANLANQVVQPLRFSFSDGYQTITEQTGDLTEQLFYVYTDASGNITNWIVFLVRYPYTAPVAPPVTSAYQLETIGCGACSTVPLDANNTIFSSSHDHVGLDPEVTTEDDGAVQSNPGVWTSSTLPLAITTTGLPGGVQNQPYAATLAASGGSGNYSWAIGGIGGLTVNAATGVISGSPSAGGTNNLGATVTDTVTNASVSATFPINLSIGPLAITSSTALGGFTPGANIAASLAAIGGAPPYTWTASNPPAGLTLNAAGQLAGKAPATPGTYSFAATVSDPETPAGSASATFTFSVLGFTTGSPLPSATTATAYSLRFAAIGGTPPYTFSATSLPGGLNLAASGLLSGTATTPTAGGNGSTATGTFTVQVADANNLQVSQPFSLTVGTGVQPIEVAGGVLPDGATTTSYSQTLQAENGKPPYTWSLLGGALPQGLVLSAAGTISGTAIRPGGAAFTARATDSSGGFASASFTIAIDPAPLQVTAISLPNGMVGLPYGPQPVNAIGGYPPYSFVITQGSLPAPLTFVNGQVNGGTPSLAGAFDFTVTATDAIGDAASGSFALTVEPTGPDLLLSQASVFFATLAGATAMPAAASVTLGSSVSSALAYTVQVASAASWLQVTGDGTTPGAITISLQPANTPQLAPGAYQTAVMVSCAAVGPCTGSVHAIAVSLVVSSPAPQLTLGAALLSFSATGAGQPALSQPLNIQNTGGGSITNLSVTAADSWVTIDGLVALPLAAGQTDQLSVGANPAGLSPGYYQSTITVISSAGSVSVPVTLLIAVNATMTLSPAGSQFPTVAGIAPGNASGSFLVSVSGTSTVNWAAKVLPVPPATTTPAWLTLTTTSGSSTSVNPGAVSFSINAAALSLAPQPYYATIEISASGSVVTDPLQDYQLVLNVTPPTNTTQPNPDPQGLIFLSAAPGKLPGQTVQVFASSSGVSYSAVANGGTWLSVTPSSGATSSAAPGQSSVSIDTTGLAHGIYYGGVNYAIAGQVRTVNVTLIVEGGATAQTVSGRPVPETTSPPCTPSQLIPAQTGLVSNFSLPTSWPAPLEITVLDDCGTPVTTGQVVTTFSNGDPPLVLAGEGGSAGVYSGTWTPRATASQVTISAQASAQGLHTGSVQITGQVTRNATPVLDLNGTLNAFINVQGSPLAPGTIAQIYGENLAAQVVVPSGIPLQTLAGNTMVLMGGIVAPLYYVSPRQINAQVPFELTPGETYQVIVNANGAFSTPNPIQISMDAPGIAAFPGGAIIAQHAATNAYVTDAAPAVPGEYIVFYLAGMGPTSVPVASGAASPGGSDLAYVTDPVTMTIDGTVVPISFAGLTPTLVGLYQVDFQVPAGTPNGDLQLVITQPGGASNLTILPVHN